MSRTILYAIVLILALSFFGISIKAIVNSPVGQENIQFVWNVIQSGWHWLVQTIGQLVSIAHAL